MSQSLKKTLMKQGMKLMSDPRVMKLMQDQRVMKAVMQVMGVPGQGAVVHARQRREDREGDGAGDRGRGEGSEADGAPARGAGRDAAEERGGASVEHEARGAVAPGKLARVVCYATFAVWPPRAS